MESPLERPAEEVKRLQRCINDLVALLALPASWAGSEPLRIADTFADALLRMLRLDLIYVRLNESLFGLPIEIIRTAPWRRPAPHLTELCSEIGKSLHGNPQDWQSVTRKSLGNEAISMVPVPLGLDAGIGAVVAGSQCTNFPEQTEKLLISVAANQAVIGLQQALLLNEQKKASNELARRVAERTSELAETNKELQLQVELLQHLPVSAWTLKPDGTSDFVNQVWLEYSGQTLDFVRSHPEAWMTAVHPEDREAASRSFWDGVRSGQGFAMETRSRRAQDGVYRWHLNQAVVLRDADGKVLKFVGTTTDIDDQKRAEEELRATENDLRKILDGIPGLVYTLNPTGQVELPNRRLLEYFGKTLDELNSWATNDAVHPDDLPRVIADFTHSISTGTSYDSELRYRRADGVYRWFQVRALPVSKTDGRMARWYCLISDIEDRKRAEDALRASENNLRQIVDNIPGLVATLSPSGEIELVNQQYLDYFGKSLDEIKSWRVNDILLSDDLRRVEAAFTNAMTTGTALIEEFRCVSV